MTNKCKKCDGEMIESIALLNNVTDMSVPDFPGNTTATHGQTVTFRSDGQLHDCLKCSKCGWSMTAAKEQP